MELARSAYYYRSRRAAGREKALRERIVAVCEEFLITVVDVADPTPLFRGWPAAENQRQRLQFASGRPATAACIVGRRGRNPGLKSSRIIRWPRFTHDRGGR